MLKDSSVRAREREKERATTADDILFANERVPLVRGRAGLLIKVSSLRLNSLR